MQSAPSVAYPVGRFSWQSRFCVASLYGLGVASLTGLVICWPAQKGAGLVLLLGLAWTAWLVVAWRACRAMPAGTLRWDAFAAAGGPSEASGCWWWQEEGHSLSDMVVSIERRLDWGSGMLLHGRVVGRAQWFWLDRESAAGRWGELRRALEAQANTA